MGPFNAKPTKDTASRKRLFVCEPKSQAEESACAATILKTVARRAYRRDVTAEDMQPVLAEYSKGRAEGSFDKGIVLGLRMVLMSPDFLFRVEVDPAKARKGQLTAVSDYELATRLSFFLWSSIPDDALLDAARKGKLRSANGRATEARRLLADPRSKALVENFAMQWLGLQELETALPNPDKYPEFDEALRSDFREETELFLARIVQEDRSVMDVITGDYTYVNERLATLYGLKAPTAPGFNRVSLPADSHRGGILGQGSVLMITSHGLQTSPVLRGKWVLSNLLNSPPAAPPAGVPPLDTAPANGKKLTTREQVERHRANPVCASCHNRMDPYGFALENFDVLGRWRENDDGGAIDATAKLASGATFKGVAGLKAALQAHPEEFVTAFVARMMTYALGRELDARDQPAVRKIVRDAARNGYRFSDLVSGVVETTQFKMRMM